MANNSYQAAAYARVWQIQQMLSPKPSDLISASRFFVREGELSMWNQKKRKKSKRYFFLFNDIMLLTKRQSSKKYTLRIHITLRSPSVSVESIDSASFNWEFRLHCRTRSFILYAASEEDRNFWYADMEKSVKGTHDEEKAQAQAKKDAKTSDGCEVKAPEEITPRTARTQSVIVTPKSKKDKGADSARNRSASELPAAEVARAKSASGIKTGGSTSSIKKKKAADDMHLRSSPGVIQHEVQVAPVPLENNVQTGIFLYPNPMTTNNPFLDVPAVNQNPFATNTFATNNPYATNSPFAPGARATVDPALFRNAGFGTQPQPAPSAFGTQTYGSSSGFGTQTFGSATFGSSSQLTVAPSPNPFATTPNPVSTNPFATNTAVANPNPFATTPRAPVMTNPNPNPNPFATNPQPTANPFTTPSSQGHFF